MKGGARLHMRWLASGAQHPGASHTTELVVARDKSNAASAGIAE